MALITLHVYHDQQVVSVQTRLRRAATAEQSGLLSYRIHLFAVNFGPHQTFLDPLCTSSYLPPVLAEGLNVSVVHLLCLCNYQPDSSWRKPLKLWLKLTDYLS